MSKAPSAKSLREQSTAGLVYAISAYGLWGLLPGYFILLQPSGPYEIVAWRVILSVVFCVLLITVVRGWRRTGALLRDRRVMGWLALAAAFIAVNWTVFVYATATDQVVEASLGYFINPLITILLGVIFLRERMRPLQWAAVGVAFIAVLILAIGHGSFPWVALMLAFSFGLYGLVKNRTGGRVDAVSGLAIETAYLTPFAALVLVGIGLGWQFLDPAGIGLTFAVLDPWHTVALSLAGVVTTVPLLLFAAGVRRLPLSYVGLTQFLAPVMQFLTGVLILGEPMPLERWIGFGIVWIALILLVIDMVRAIMQHRRAADLPELT